MSVQVSLGELDQGAVSKLQQRSETWGGNPSPRMWKSQCAGYLYHLIWLDVSVGRD